MEDSEIVKLYFDRNEQAITQTAEKYGGYCTGIAMNILGSSEDAEECVNDTYMKAWSSIPPHKPSVLSAFLARIVRNLSFNRYKAAHAAKRGGHSFGLILDELGEIVSGSESVEDSVDRAELAKELDAFIAALSEEKRYMFLRRYWYSDSIAQIAEACGRSENSAAVELSRIRSRLRRYLTERGFDL